jgi:hypothetical protein
VTSAILQPEGGKLAAFAFPQGLKLAGIAGSIYRLTHVRFKPDMDAPFSSASMFCRRMADGFVI